MAGRCMACEAPDLDPYLAVHEVGEAELIPTTDDYGAALSDIVRCRVCGHGQLEQIPTVAELADAYGEASSTELVTEERGQRATARATLEMIEGHVAPGRLLDLGCWVGFLLDEARERGWEVMGVEPSRFASAYARDELGLEVQTTEILDADLRGGRASAVVLGDVVEHLPDPGEALARIAELLRPEGVLFMALPDAGSLVARALGRRWWSVLPTHVHYFTRTSVLALLARLGYRPLQLTTAPKAFTVRYYLGRLRGYSPAVGEAAVGAAERVGVADRLWAPDFRDRLAVVARAPAS